MFNERISSYDATLIRPRELEIIRNHQIDHESHSEWLKNLQRNYNKIKTTIDEWKWPIKIVIGMLSAILMGVLAIVFDIIKKGLAK